MDLDNAHSLIEASLQRYYKEMITKKAISNNLSIHTAKGLWDEYYELRELLFEKFYGHKRFEKLGSNSKEKEKEE